jgi:hypothetical protein
LRSIPTDREGNFGGGIYMPLRFHISVNNSSMESILLIGLTEGRRKRNAWWERSFDGGIYMPLKFHISVDSCDQSQQTGEEKRYTVGKRLDKGIYMPLR